VAGKLAEPEVITDYNQYMVCILPPRFYNDDARYEEQGEALTSIDLLKIFPDEPALKDLAAAHGADAGIPEDAISAIRKRS
jgi:hypothetical protein